MDCRTEGEYSAVLRYGLISLQGYWEFIVSSAQCNVLPKLPKETLKKNRMGETNILEGQNKVHSGWERRGLRAQGFAGRRGLIWECQ